MSSLANQLSQRVQTVAGVDPELRSATKPQFGHFQSNVALRLAKQRKANPREIAAQIIAELDVSDLCETPEIAGPGFINFRLTPQVLAGAANAVLESPAAGIEKTEAPQTIVIDYSSPNVAKQMHVGHLRSTVIGDCFRRVLTALGHNVISENHIGDWGRQFGMLVEQVLDEGLDVPSLSLADAEALYVRANDHFNSDENFAARARARVVALQSGEELTRKIWQQLIDVSIAGFNETYERMDILLTSEDVAGESKYNDLLPQVCADLESRGVATVDDGALVVFVGDDIPPAIIRNRNGGYGYATSDMAAIKQRVEDLGADRIIYVVGMPQALHFKQVFAAARKAGYLSDGVVAEHIGFGQVLGADGKRFATRDGTAVYLNDLLDAAEAESSRPVALAAIKYADLSSGLQKDYVFDFERMAATTGDTGPYLQYAHARVCQILRRADAEGYTHDKVGEITEIAEHDLALKLSRFGEVVAEVAEDLAPHKLCGYLFELATALSSFYENCPVLKSEPEVRASRLALCDATRRVLATGLNLLGIQALERM